MTVINITEILHLNHPAHKDPFPLKQKDNNLFIEWIEGLESTTTFDLYTNMLMSHHTHNLKVTNVQLHKDLNGLEHKTNMYDLMEKELELIIRRGKPFWITINLSNRFLFELYEFNLQFYVKDCKVPKPSTGTEVNVPICFGDELSLKEKKWKAVCKYISKDGHSLYVQIFPPSNTIVNKWKMSIYTKYKNKLLCYRHPEIINILFNAMNSDDDAYLLEESKLNEYIFNEYGSYYIGLADQFITHRWYYGQFDENILNAVFYLINTILKVPYQECNSVLTFAKAFSIENIEEKIFSCPWPKDDRAGTHQMQWEGSAMILNSLYYNHGPVNMSNCYLLTCVLVTVFRALGIGSRTVTGFGFAYSNFQKHKFFMNKFISTQGGILEEISDLENVSYTWTEAFMKRNDCEPVYSGWNLFGLIGGPAPVTALKNAMTDKPYDVLQYYNCIQGNKLYWIFNEDLVAYKLIDFVVGFKMKIISKEIDSWGTQDITNYYHQITSEDMISAHEEANKITIIAQLRPLYEETNYICHICNRSKNSSAVNKIQFKIMPPKEFIIGDSIKIQYQLINSDPEIGYSISLIFSLRAILYNGKTKFMIKESSDTIIANPESELSDSFEATPNEYLKRMTPHSLFKFTALVRIEETEDYIFKEFDFIMIHPKLMLKVIGEMTLKKTHIIAVDFQHPSIALNNSRITVEEMANHKHLISSNKVRLGKDDKISMRYIVKPLKPGRFFVKAVFSSEFGYSVSYLDYYINKL